MPFITEEIWQALPKAPGIGENDFLMLQQWPEQKGELAFPNEEKAMDLIIEATRAVRTKRSELNVPPSKKAHLTIATAETEIFTLGIPLLKRLAYASDVTVTGEAETAGKGMVEAITHAARVFMPLSELVDLEQEKKRLEKELGQRKNELAGLEARLNNPAFTSKAPEQVVAGQRARAEELKSLIAKLEESLASME